jgi:hypothetical protein
MNAISCTLLLTFTLLVSQNLQAQIDNEAASDSVTKSQLLILTNGETMRGAITPRDDDRVEVQMASGSKIILPKSSIDFVADSLDEAYWQRVARTKASDLVGQVELFRWCIIHGLHDQARNQFIIAQELEIGGADLARMATELEIAQRRADQLDSRKSKSSTPSGPSQEFVASLLGTKNESNLEKIEIRPLPELIPEPDEKTQTANVAATDWNSSPPSIPTAPGQIGTVPASALQPIESSGNFAKRIPNSANRGMQLNADGNWSSVVEAKDVVESNSSEQEVVQVTYEQEITEKKSGSYPVMIPAHQLDRETRAMPEGTIGVFKRTIEPIMMRNCYQCHRGNDEVLPLIRMAAGHTVPRRMSQRNLHHLMRHVDREDPLNSPALIMAMTPHGNQDKPSLRPDSSLATKFRAWLIEVSNDPVRWRPLVYQTIAVETAETNGLDDSVSANDSVPTEAPSSTNQLPSGKVDFSNRLPMETNSSADPFDPAVFNSRPSTRTSNLQSPISPSLQTPAVPHAQESPSSTDNK